MYSIVLLAAVGGGSGSAGADVSPIQLAPVVPAPVVVGGGCSGYYATVGYGGGGASCWGSGPGTCHGGRMPGLFGHRFSCHGGGMFGSQVASCGGGGYYTGGYYPVGGSYYPGGYGGCGGWSTYYGYSGVGSVYGAYNYPPYGYPTVVPPPSDNKFIYPGRGEPTTPETKPGTGTKPETTPEKKPETTPEKKPGGNDGMGANLKLRVPAEAKIYVDGRLTTGDGTERAFFTPALEPGQKYYYDVKAEVVVAGRVVVEEKRVVVVAGAEVTESFASLFAALGLPAPSVASK